MSQQMSLPFLGSKEAIPLDSHSKTHSKSVEQGVKMLSWLLSRIPEGTSFSATTEEATQLSALWHENTSFRQWVRSLERPDLIRCLRKSNSNSATAERLTLQAPGRELLLFRGSTPTEQQSRIATNNVVELWYDFLLHNKHCPPLVNTVHRVHSYANQREGARPGRGPKG